MLVEKQEIEAAAKLVGPFLAPTPLVRAHHCSRELDADIYFKLETLQPTHSFKVRGAFSALARLDHDERKRGVVTASGGNHGLAIAYAAAVLGVPAAVYLPTSATQAKLSAIRRFNPEIIIHGRDWDDAHMLATKVAHESGRPYIHPFANTSVMAGQGTIVIELLEQIPKPDLIVASIGGGGLISGILSAVQHFSPGTRVYGVETLGADCMHQSRSAGEIVELRAITSIAETLGARKTEKMQFDIVTKHAADLVTVSDDAAIGALLLLLQEEKLLVEPAASCSLAALLEGKIPVRSGETVVVVLCGANVTFEQVQAWSRQTSDARRQPKS